MSNNLSNQRKWVDRGRPPMSPKPSINVRLYSHMEWTPLIIFPRGHNKLRWKFSCLLHALRVNIAYVYVCQEAKIPKIKSYLLPNVFGNIKTNFKFNNKSKMWNKAFFLLFWTTVKLDSKSNFLSFSNNLKIGIWIWALLTFKAVILCPLLLDQCLLYSSLFMRGMNELHFQISLYSNLNHIIKMLWNPKF